jgi:hypothetical protein
MKAISIAVLILCALTVSANADGVRGYGVQIHYDIWDERDITSKAPAVMKVACRNKDPVNKLLEGDRILRVDRYLMHNAVRPEFDGAIRTLRDAPHSVVVVICRSPCKRIQETHRITLEPQTIDWDEPCK